MYFVSTLMTNIVKLGWNWITYVQAQNASSLSETIKQSKKHKTDYLPSVGSYSWINRPVVNRTSKATEVNEKKNRKQK